ncbi:phage protein NinX family protein [Citrobacter amalonaticus]|uniref:phage protein NinX family protein n=1 Tax=Citrobacter amalonaticus TaxID=35703 RepID=UPI0015C5042C|nr:phage protein NinX family protein [Citrobacter amalonaticus]
MAIKVACALGAVEVDGIYSNGSRVFDFDDPTSPYWFDPCNNVEDAWPIMESNEISIVRDRDNGRWIAIAGFSITENEWSFCDGPEYEMQDRKPFRAAMALFIQMQNDQLDKTRFKQ